MGTLIYYNGSLTVPVGSKDAVNDLNFDQVEGFVYLLKEFDLIFNTSADTANAWHAMWLSVLRDGRTTYNPFNEGFSPDILAADLRIKSASSFGIEPLETPNRGYVANDPYFASAIRFGVSGAANVAGADVDVEFRATAERIKSTSAIQELMYGRSYT